MGNKGVEVIEAMVLIPCGVFADVSFPGITKEIAEHASASESKNEE